MDINWKLRFKNKAVLTGLIGALLLFIKQITDLFGFDLSNQLNQASAIIGAILTLLTGIGVITDPTSKGVADSSIAQTYQAPRDSSKEEQQVTWKTSQDASLTPELSTKAPK
ncbi:phage holin, partial [Staphylococcus aureus]|nr:phage holin [Staphylococcus aureus]